MSDLDPSMTVLARPLSDPLKSFARAAVGGLGLVILSGLALVGLDAALGVALAGYAVGVALVAASMRRGYPHGRLGLCNGVTLARLALAASLLAPLGSDAAAWGVLGVAVLALSLDGVDGWLARRERLVSDFGARFDMEVDSAFALILALNAWAAGTVGAAVLLLGLPRYAFLVAAWVWPWVGAPLPERFSRKVVCVVQIAVLIALQAPFVAGFPALALVAGTVVALIWSFGRDTLWLWRAQA
jgi:phosphatidylglycerophosphate synthase